MWPISSATTDTRPMLAPDRTSYFDLKNLLP